MPKKSPDIISSSRLSLTSSFIALDSDGDLTSFSYGSPSNLKLYLDVSGAIDSSAGPVDRSTNSSNIQSSTFLSGSNGVEDYFQVALGNFNYNTAKFDDSDAINAVIDYGTNSGSFVATTAPGTATSIDTNKSFSISLWFRRNSAHATTNFTVGGLFSIGGSTSGLGNNETPVAKNEEIQIKLNENEGKITFVVRDTNQGNNFTLTSDGSNSPVIDPSLYDDVFAHLVAVYDTTPGDQTGLKVYINGEDIAGHTTSTATKPIIRGDVGTIHIGAIHNGADEWDGNIAEVAYWSGTALTQNEAKAIYFGTRFGEAVIQNNYNSGFLNNPVRTVIRDRDQRAGVYPTLNRMNRRGTSGISSNIRFDDTTVINYGNAIKDDFTIREENVLSKAVDSSRWVTSTADVLVRKEFDPRNDFELTTGAVILAGVGDDNGHRWLQTKNKVGNPTLTFSLLQGPYNNTGALARFRLNLGKGKSTDVFKVQGSFDGTNWTDVKLKNVHLGSTDRSIVDESSNAIVPISISSFRQKIFGNTSINVGQQIKPLHKVKIDPVDFARSGFTEPFYIRLIQPSVSNTNIAVWAIGDVNISSRDQQVTYPYLATSDRASTFHLSSSIATPNFINSLVASSSFIPGISDAGVVPFEGQQHSAFNEESTIQMDNSDFFSVGTKDDVAPGFGQSLSSKTIINYLMKPADADVLSTGLTRKGTNAAVGLSNDDGQMLLTYWNFRDNKWEEIGQPLRDNRGNHADETVAHNHLFDNITGSCAGFGPIVDSLVEGDVGNFELKSRKALEYSFMPISTYGFPNAAKYHAKENQHITARELGITKPFLLEKINLDFDIKFAVPGTRTSSPGSAADADAFNTIAAQTGQAATFEVRRLKIFTPTFFLLRQSEKRNHPEMYLYNTSTPGTLGRPGTFTEEVPKTIKLTSGSNVETLIKDSRELITYGQYNLFVTASTDAQNFADRFVDSGISMTDILTSGIVRDGFSVSEVSDSGEDKEIHVIDSMRFPSRVAARHKNVLSVIVHNNEPSGNFNNISFVKLDNANKSREYSIDGSSRALIQGVSSTELTRSPKGETMIVSSSGDQSSVLTNETLTFDSPYLILPDDKIIFGWQYPMPRDLRFPKGTPGSTPNSMKVQSCNLKMFGSQVKQGIEFHEGLNQNLTSNAIHEVIGNEPVIDQWDIAPRAEYSGSLQDGLMYSWYYQLYDGEEYEGSIQPTGGNAYSLGSIIAPAERKNVGPVQSKFEVGTLPYVRVGARGVGASGVYPSLMSILGPDFNTLIIEVLDGPPIIDGPDLITSGNQDYKAPTNGFLRQIQKFENHVDTRRTFSDARINQYRLDTTYGTSQNYTRVNLTELLSVNRDVRLGGSPKYYFSNTHYGHFVDFLRQGYDGKFERDIQAIRNNTVVANPITVKFVEDDFDEENLNFKQYRLIKPNRINNTAYETFQSSNISLFATSSLPFKEGRREDLDVDDDVPTNRIYAVDVIEVE